MIDYEAERRKQTTKLRSTMDYVMGGLFALTGIFFLVYNALGIELMGRKPSSLDYAIGGLFLLYGAWRIYRGYKKNYFRD